MFLLQNVLIVFGRPTFKHWNGPKQSGWSGGVWWKLYVQFDRVDGRFVICRRFIESWIGKQRHIVQRSKRSHSPGTNRQLKFSGAAGVQKCQNLNRWRWSIEAEFDSVGASWIRISARLIVEGSLPVVSMPIAIAAPGHPSASINASRTRALPIEFAYIETSRESTNRSVGVVLGSCCR